MSDPVPQTRAPDAPFPAPDAAPALPSHIGRYRVERLLGEGGFGVVYLARDEDLCRPVAIKVPQPARLARPGAINAYLAEARTLAGLNHPHIVRVYDFGRTEDGGCYLVSEYIAGGSLEHLLRCRRLSPGEAAGLAVVVAEALHHAHRHGLVHRDVKPANIPWVP
jgi:serine/threonine protein kinase